MRRGIPVSPGVADGTAYCIDDIFVVPGTQKLRDQEIAAELTRYETARDHAARDLMALEEKVAKHITSQAAQPAANKGAVTAS